MFRIFKIITIFRGDYRKCNALQLPKHTLIWGSRLNVSLGNTRP